MHEQRLNQFRKYLSEKHLDAFCVSKPASLKYLLSFSGTNGLGLITEKTVFFITDFRYKEQANSEVAADDIVIAEGSLIKSLKNLPIFNHIKRCGFESENITFNNYQNLQEVFADVVLMPFSEAVDTIASVKSPDEIKSLKKACDITLSVFNAICPLFHENVVEIEIAAEISYRIKKEGGDGDAFEPCVLFGSNSALPHGTPGNTKLQPGDVIQLDFGAVSNGYHADFSRVLFKGEPSKKKLSMHYIVRSALERAIECIEPEKPANEIDAAARSVIQEYGYGSYFGHAVGHGVGLSIHTLPKISQQNKEPVEVGNVFTVEPGIYIPGVGGVRIEDVVCVEQFGKSILTEAPRDLTIV